MTIFNSIFDFFMKSFDSDFWVFLIRLLSAILFSTIIGIERELTGHKGSIKTNTLICLGACIFTSYEAFICQDTRMAANVITGVGFLCSGFIFKNGLNVSGLGTAATLWCSAGVGILTSRGYLVESFSISILLFILNLILAKTSFKIKPLKAFDDSQTNIMFTYNIVCLKENVEEIKKKIIENISKYSTMNIESSSIKTITEDKVRIVIEVNVDNKNIIEIEDALSGVNDINGVLSSSWKQED